MIGKVLGGGMKWAIRGGIAFGVAEIIVKPMLESASSGKDKNWWNNPFGAASPTARDASGWNSTRQALKNVTHWFDMTRHDIGHIWDMMWDNTAGRAIRGGHNVEATVNGVKHTIANQFDGVRHSIASSWDGAWDSVRNRAVSGAHNTAAQLDGFRHNAANNFDSARHAAASAWDKAWDAVTSRTAQGFHAVMNWIGALPGHIRDAFFGASHWLTFAGRETIQGLWNGMSVIWHKVTGWISGLAGWIKSHKGPLSFDRNLLVPAGKALMSGLHTGLLSGFRSGPFGFISGLAGTIGGLIANKFSGLFGGGGAGSGVQRWSPLVLQVLKMLHQSPSWLGLVLRRMNQESGGNPRAINLTDSNAAMGDPSRGLMQTIMGTFMAYAGPFRGLGIYNPLANIFAGLNYALHRYGSLAALGRPGGYAAGGIAGGWIMAGEHGRELIKIPRGSHVRSNPDTERMMDGGGRIHITIGLGQGYGDGKIMREIIRQLKIVVHDEGGSVQDTLGWRA
jgi:hypothetical protein